MVRPYPPLPARIKSLLSKTKKGGSLKTTPWKGFLVHIYHWVPSSGAPPAWSCVHSWINLQLPDGAKRTFKQSLAGSVRYVWNNVVRDFLSTDAEWMFSTHHDVAFVPETLLRLMSWNEPLITATVFMRHNPALPQIWRTYDEKVQNQYAIRVQDTRKWFYEHKEYIRPGPFVMEPKPDDALVEVGFTSTACTLIHRSVFEDIRAKIPNQGDGLWFVCDNELTGGGEDRRFYEYAKHVGYIPYVDRSCIAGHVAGDIPTSSLDFIAWDSVGDFLNTGEPLKIDLDKVEMDREYRASKEVVNDGD